MNVSYTLVADGSSDRVLLPLLDWVLRRHGFFVVDRAWASDLALLGARGLRERVWRAVEAYPCDLVFVHRDAEAESPAHRFDEIRAAVADLATPNVAVVPVRMTEAWLLHDERAIRHASGNPGGQAPLALPRLRDLERVPDPKATLFAALQAAADLGARRTRRLQRDLPQMRLRVAELIEDFSALDTLPAFQRLCDDVRALGA